MRRFFVLMVLFSLSGVLAASDVVVFQGQYFVDDELQQGTFNFLFNVYNDETGGDLVYSYEENLTTGRWGQWKVELVNLSLAASDTSKDYFVEIIVDGVVQDGRERVTHFNFLRKDVDEVTEGKISAAGFDSGIDSGGRSFLDVLGNDVAYFVSGGNFLGVADVTQFYLTDTRGASVNFSGPRQDSEKGVGFSLFPFGDASIGYLWANIRGGAGGFFMFDTEDVSEGIDFRQVGAFTDRWLALGHDGTTTISGLKSEGSAGMDFVIFSDAVGGRAFYVDSSNDYETTIHADLNVTGEAYFSNVSVDGKAVCLSDGTNCVMGSSGNLTEQDPYWNFDKFNYYTKTEVDEKIESVGFGDVLVLEETSEPDDPEKGTIYFDGDVLMFYDGSTWYELSMKKLRASSTTSSKTGSSFVSEDNVVSEEVVEDNVEEVIEDVSSEEVVSEEEITEEVVEEVCEDVCSTEEVCEDVENCEEVCEKKGKEENCEDVCSTEEVCEDVENCEEVCGIPEQLFDIRFDLDLREIEDSSDLSGFVTFESFGRVPTPVNLTFRVFDGEKEVYVRRTGITVSTEEVYRWKYTGDVLSEGNYYVVLETVYSDNVYDEFRQDFNIKYGFWKRFLGIFGV